MLKGTGRGLATAALVLLAALVGCGEGKESEDPLAKYSGRFTVVEVFQSQEGPSCPAPPAAEENLVTVKIEKSDFAANFSERWGKMAGEIGNDLYFVAVNSDVIPGLSLQLSGTFTSLDAFSATMREIFQGCTRARTLSGTREGT